MANVSENAAWEAGIFRWELNTPAEGGEYGAAVLPIKQLANRTVYLKARLDALESGAATPGALTEHIEGLDPHPQYVTGEELAAAMDAASVPQASETDAGKVELATAGETSAGIDSERAIHPAGLAAAMLGGVGQTWQLVTGSRAAGVNYVNSTGRPIVVSVSWSSGSLTPTIGGVQFGPDTSANNNTETTGSFIVPHGATYSIGASIAITKWIELR